VSTLGWQDAVATLIVLGALVYLVRRNLRARKGATACSACPGCAVAPDASSAPRSPAGETLVSIGVAADALARRQPGG